MSDIQHLRGLPAGVKIKSGALKFDGDPIGLFIDGDDVGAYFDSLAAALSSLDDVECKPRHAALLVDLKRQLFAVMLAQSGEAKADAGAPA